jgi:hypothetical protein
MGFKLKCNGEKTGCQRCVSAGFDCSYKNERPTERKRKHHLLPNTRSEGRVAQAPQSPHQSKLQISPGKEKPARRALPTQEMSPELDEMVVQGLEDQDTISPLQPETYSNAESRSDSIHQVENIRGNFVPTTPASLQRPTSAAVPMPDSEHSAFEKEFFDQYFTTLEQDNDIFSRALQQHGAVSPMEDEGATIDISNSSETSTHSIDTTASSQRCCGLVDGKSSLEDTFTFSTDDSPPFPGSLNSLPQTMTFPSTSSRGSGKSGNRSRYASIDSYVESDSTPYSCQCTRSALKILEMLSSHFKPAEGLYSTEQALYTLKRNIRKCQSLVQCSASGRDSGVELLVIVLCEKMTAIFEKISASWERQLHAVARMKQKKPGVAAGVSEADPATQNDFRHSQCSWVTTGGYQIDTIEERHMVFGLLFQLQLKRLSDIMTTLRKNAMANDLESHLAILMPTNQKVMDLKAALGKITIHTQCGTCLALTS